MKVFAFIFCCFLLTSCQEIAQNNEDSSDKANMNIELEAIESTRNSFIQAIDEKRYQDLSNLTTEDIIQVAPNDSEWNTMYRLRGELGLFPYDSIRMDPIETVILNDSMAYDFGVSTVYYADSLGQTHQLKDTFLAIMKKDSLGKWRLHREVASSRLPGQK